MTTNSLDKQFKSAAIVMGLGDITTLRINVTQLYRIDPDMVTSENIWWILLIQFTINRGSIYKNSVLLNRKEVTSLFSTPESGIYVLDTIGDLIADKMNRTRFNCEV